MRARGMYRATVTACVCCPNFLSATLLNPISNITTLITIFSKKWNAHSHSSSSTLCSVLILKFIHQWTEAGFWLKIANHEFYLNALKRHVSLFLIEATSKQKLITLTEFYYANILFQLSFYRKMQGIFPIERRALQSFSLMSYIVALTEDLWKF